MAMPNTSDEGSVENQSRQDATGNVIQNTIAADSNNFPSYIIRTLQE